MDTLSWGGNSKDGVPWNLYCGDAAQTLKKRVGSESVDCIVTSPPYFSQRDYGVDGQLGLEPRIDQYVENILLVTEQLHRVLKKTGVFFLNLGDTYYSAKGLPRGNDRKHKARRFGLRAVDASGLGVPRKTLIGIPWRVALAMIDQGWILRAPIVWARPDAMPEPTAHDRPWRTYEHVFMFTKSPRYFFRRDSLRELEDIWTIKARPRREDRLHSAPFPDALASICLDIGCPEGGVVLDPFAGSGTTLRVALEKGLGAQGIELNQAFCAHILERLGMAATDDVSL